MAHDRVVVQPGEGHHARYLRWVETTTLTCSISGASFCHETMNVKLSHAKASAPLPPACVLLLGLMTLEAVGANPSFHDGFMEASRVHQGFLSDASLVDTNNFGPVLTNAPISYAGFTHGELAGIRLGTTMDEVVATWGRPSRAYTRCYGGPRFWYGPGSYGDRSLLFNGDRLVLIAITRSENLVFDNGLTGTMGRVESEKMLGLPTRSDPERPIGLYLGEITYETNQFRTDLWFTDTWGSQSRLRRGGLSYIAVRLGEVAVYHPAVNEDASAKGR